MAYMSSPINGVKKPRGKYWVITLARGVFALALGLGLFLPSVDSSSNLLKFYGHVLVVQRDFKH